MSTKMSELLRIGAAKRPQATGNYYIDGATCAMGAIYDAIPDTDIAYNAGLFNNDRDDLLTSTIEAETGVESMRRIAPPEELLQYARENGRSSYCANDGMTLLRDVIVELNDELNWTREAIADWLESEGL